MNKLIPLFFIFLCLLLQSVKAEMVVVVNKKNSIDSLSKSEVIDLYMGRHSSFSNGLSSIPVDQPRNSRLKQLFYQRLIGKSLAKVNAYWAKLVFTGRANPHKIVTDSKSMQQFVTNNINAIGYLDSEDIDTNLKIVYRFESF